MLHDGKRAFQGSRAFVSPTADARRLRLEYNRLRRRISALEGVEGAEGEIEGLKSQIDRVARDLSLVRADGFHAVEAKLRVALDMRGDAYEPAAQRLLSSVLSDVHYLAMLTPPPD